VFSGVNNGLNMADDIMYSGTVAGAAEGVMFGKTGIALSVERNGLSAFEAGFDSVIEFLKENCLLEGSHFLNINIPENKVGIQITHQTKNATETKFKAVAGGYKMVGQPNRTIRPNDDFGDIAAYLDGFVSITPLTNDRTDYEKLAMLKRKTG